MRLSMLCLVFVAACVPSPLVPIDPDEHADASRPGLDASVSEQRDASNAPIDASVVDAGSTVVELDAGEGCVFSDAGTAEFSRGYQFVRSDAGVQDKAFYLLTLLSADDRIRASLARENSLAAIATAREAAFRTSPERCVNDVSCYRDSLALSATDVSTSGAALAKSLGTCATARLAQTHLRPSGSFILHASSTDGELLAAAWADTARALAEGFEQFAASLDPVTLRAVVMKVRDDLPGALNFYEPMLRVVVAAMAAQNRDEAIRYDPLASGQNAAAIAALSSTVWADYPYTVMLVPGQGPEGSEPFSPIGKKRCDIAAANYANKRAPFLLLSGGHVHPDRTAYSEAIEMKKYLMTEKNIPEAAILVDPYARHTTTNLRNLARAIFRLGIPSDRKALITSDPVQTLIIAYQTPGDCRKDLGYEPFTALNKLNSSEVSVLPSRLGLQADGRDPLDP